jgi:hypothetical protein
MTLHKAAIHPPTPFLPQQSHHPLPPSLPSGLPHRGRAAGRMCEGTRR